MLQARSAFVVDNSTVESCAIKLSGFVDAGFVPALPFHHGYLEPDCVERRGGGGGGGGAYLRDTTVFVGKQEYFASKTGFLHVLNTVLHHSQNGTHFHVLKQYLVLAIVICQPFSFSTALKILIF